MSALSVAASAVDYYVSDGRPLPDELVIRWTIGRHPCDQKPYFVGIDFPRD